MKEQNKKQEQKANGKGSGIGAFVGAVTGIFAGTAIQAEAAEATEPVGPTDIVYPEVVFHTSHTTVTPEPVKPEPVGSEPVTPEPVNPEPEPTPDPNPQLKVLGVETVQNENGQTMTVAEVMLEGSYGQIIDADNDGIADFIGVDFDQNGQFSQDEIAYIGDSMISMQTLQEAANSTEYMANLNGPDYVNDADVNSYLA